MSDIALVIKISEEDYEYCKRWEPMSPLAKAIVNGTPLPKRHGRLIDGDLLETKLIYELDLGTEIETHGTDDVIKRVFDNAPTIIEAESESDK